MQFRRRIFSNHLYTTDRKKEAASKTPSIGFAAKDCFRYDVIKISVVICFLFIVFHNFVGGNKKKAQFKMKC